MAIDSALLSSANTTAGPPATLRLYSWSCPTISIGYRQSPADFEHFNLPVVRRLTGGRAVLHDSELTYSITVPKSNPLYDGGISTAYAAISRCLVAALKDIGVEAAGFVKPARGKTQKAAKEGQRRIPGTQACFLSSSRYEVVVDGKKMIGSAQRRLSGAFLQHGSILTGVDREGLESIFGPGLIDKITWLSAHTTSTAEQLSEALVSRFGTEMGIKFTAAPLTEAERRAVDKELQSSAETGRMAGGKRFAL